MCDGAHGTPLVPWPNRLAGGRYRFDGSDYQVALTEPAKGNAIHGFLRWRPWRAIRHDADRVVMAATVFPQTGYPFLLDVAVDYRLTGDGLVVTTTATNAGDRACPYGCGQHPYLSPGSGLLDDCDLELAAETRITTDEARQLPSGTESVGGTPFDFRTRRRIGSLPIDFAFTDLARDEEGRAWVRLWGADGGCRELWVDESYPYVEIYTGDTLAPERRRRGLGTEPMSCPPNAFQSGEGVIRLEPGASVRIRWGARLSS
jgi:aldose 1-epimerase